MHIRPFLPTDHREVAAFTAAADWGTAFVDVLFPGRKEYPVDLEQHFMRSLKAKECVSGVLTFVAETDPGDVGPNGQGVDEEGGKVVGRMTVHRLGNGVIAGRWRSVHPEGWVEARLLAVEEWYVGVFGLNKAIDVAVQRRHSDRLANMKPQPLKDRRFEEMWEVDMLVVDDRYHRRGVGKMLMQWVLRQAQNEDVPVGLRSSHAGRKLYESLGFENLGEIRWIDGDQEVKQAWMAWLPEPNEVFHGVSLGLSATKMMSTPSTGRLVSQAGR